MPPLVLLRAQLRRLPQGASAESTIRTLRSSSLLLAREDNINPKVAKPRKASKGKQVQTVHELMMAPGDAVATVQVTLKPEAVSPKIDEKTSETMTVADGTVPAPGQEDARQEGMVSNQGGEVSAVGEEEAAPAPAAGKVAAAPAWDSATPTPRSSTTGLAASLQCTLSAVKRFPSKVGRAADAAADAVIAAGRDVLAAADRLGDRLQASSSEMATQLDASWENAKVVMKEGGSKAAKLGKACLKKLGKLHRSLKKAMVCGSGSLPVEPVAVRV